ncbi:MAG: alpha/beta hydrolase-fold protein [Actinomycetaceae bacterium]|nr:alpha/beta hydrolase-fold protein [Actinomycetaceae bacterium]
MSMYHCHLSYVPDPDRSRPARVYVHLPAVDDHHADELDAMVEASDGSWHADRYLPDDVVTSVMIAPVDASFVATYDPPGPVDTRARFLALRQHALPGDHALEGVTARIKGPQAMCEPEWDDLSPKPQAWERDILADRTVWHHTPADTPVGLLVLFDGRQWVRTPLPGALTRAGLPPLEILAIDTGQGDDRVATLVPNLELSRWLKRDLLQATPWTPSETIIAGHSLGGLAALSLALGEAPIADRVLVQSGSFWYPAWGGSPGGDIATTLNDPHSIAHRRAKDVRVHLSVGLGEADMVPHTMAVASALTQCGATTTVEVSRHAHEMTGWMGALTRGLRALMRERAPLQSALLFRE